MSIISDYLDPAFSNSELQNLYNLQFYLEKELILKLDKVKKSGQVLPNHELQLTREYTLNELNFPPRVPGRVTNIQVSQNMWGNYSLTIHLSFDNSPETVLTFVPGGEFGEFVLDKTFFGNKVTVNNTVYQCAWGCEKNRLLVPLHLIEKFYPKRRVVKGSTFPP